MKQTALISIVFTLFLSVHAQEKNKSQPELSNTFYTQEESNNPESNSNTENYHRLNPGIAMTTVEKAIDLNNRGAEFFFNKNYDKAAVYFRQAAKLLPNSLQIQINLANALLKEKLYAESAEICRSSINSKYANGSIYAIFGSALYEQGKYTESADSFRKAIGFEKQNANFFNDLGNALYRAGDFQAALIAFEDALKIKPVFPDALNNYGVALVEADRYKEAIEKFLKAIEQQPTYAKAHNNLGTAYYQSGKKKLAQKCYSEAVRLSPDWNYARYNLAISYLAEGKREQARQHLEVLKKLDADLAQKLQKEFYKEYVINASEEG